MVNTKDVLRKIPDIFWDKMRYELATVFGMSLSEEDDYFLQVYGTVGFVNAFQNACKNSNCMWLLDVADDEFILEQLELRKLITFYSKYNLAKQTIYENISWCEFCHKYFPSEDMQTVELEEDICCSICNKCAINFKRT